MTYDTQQDASVAKQQLDDALDQVDTLTDAADARAAEVLAAVDRALDARLAAMADESSPDMAEVNRVFDTLEALYDRKVERSTLLWMADIPPRPRTVYGLGFFRVSGGAAFLGAVFIVASIGFAWLFPMLIAGQQPVGWVVWVFYVQGVLGALSLLVAFWRWRQVRRLAVHGRPIEGRVVYADYDRDHLVNETRHPFEVVVEYEHPKGTERRTRFSTTRDDFKPTSVVSGDRVTLLVDDARPKARLIVGEYAHLRLAPRNGASPS